MFEANTSKDTLGIHIVSFSGECDFSNKERINDTLAGLLAEAPRRLIVDLSECSILDSSGVGLLSVYKDKLKERDAGIRIAIVVGHSNYPIMKLERFNLFESAGIGLFKTIEEAKAGLSQP
ncbi:MAG: STAS domain-containing protein [Candidatus Aquicultor sp.]